MCATCGCGEDVTHEKEHSHDHAQGHAHGHGHEHSHAPEPVRADKREARLVRLERDVLAKNDRLATRNRSYLAERKILALNLVSSPGAGKTTLLERTLREADLPITVIEGDQATSLDADRIRKAGARAVQVNTGTGCHLDAAMVAGALRELDAPPGTIVAVENVGNLVCPALFDLGERAKVLIASVTEGEDKPLKYPHMFRASEVLVLNKIDLAPHVGFDEARFLACAREVNPKLKLLRVSARSGEGMAGWYAWLREERRRASARA